MFPPPPEMASGIAHLHSGPVPLVQVEGADLGDVDPQTTVDPRAGDAEYDTQVDTGPLHTCEGGAHRRHQTAATAHRQIDNFRGGTK